jgi:hypothetical protein
MRTGHFPSHTEPLDLGGNPMGPRRVNGSDRESEPYSETRAIQGRVGPHCHLAVRVRCAGRGTQVRQGRERCCHFTVAISVHVGGSSFVTTESGGPRRGSSHGFKRSLQMASGDSLPSGTCTVIVMRLSVEKSNVMVSAGSHHFTCANVRTSRLSPYDLGAERHGSERPTACHVSPMVKPASDACSTFLPRQATHTRANTRTRDMVVMNSSKVVPLPNGSRVSCGALKKDSFPNVRAPPASRAG